MLKLIDKLPTLKENNKNTEFILSAQTRDDVITEEKELKDSKSQPGTTGSVNIRFSYDFVNDRWFLNDSKIEVIDRLRS
ncbi:MAG: hypothetical protein H7Y00_10295 [Fimbriimonadaceae bacterium]|nr:hypothetical protein [Chitinophagales bacterium]